MWATYRNSQNLLLDHRLVVEPLSVFTQLPPVVKSPATTTSHPLSQPDHLATAEPRTWIGADATVTELRGGDPVERIVKAAASLGG